MSSSASLLGFFPAETLPDAPLLALDRAVGEVRRTMPVRLTDVAAAAIILPVEGCEARSADWLAGQSAGGVTLVLTGRRAQSLGWLEAAATDDLVAYVLPADSCRPEVLARIADPVLTRLPLPDLRQSRVSPPAYAAEAVRLMKLAYLLPAVLFLAGDIPVAAEVAVSVIGEVDRRSAAALRKISEARVPLAEAEDARIVAFRPADGGPDHLAILVGQPDFSTPVPVRLHSSCVTGDLLGSLRCDCGEQLRGAIRTLSETGGGVVLYLVQEGRGIGIASKLRAYALQDQGLDTVDANEHLGYEPDERDYGLAAAMLRQLGIGAIRLLTNNPAKIAALAEAGIEVVERVRHAYPANPHNARYLAAKAAKAGHMLT